MVNAQTLPVKWLDCWVVDDSAAITRLVGNILDIHFNPKSINLFNDPHQAATRLEQTTYTLPHLIFIDLNMPGMDGIEFLRHLAKANYKGGLVVCSGMSPRLLKSVEELAKTHGLNIIGSIIKPIKEQAIVNLVEKFILSTQDHKQQIDNPEPKILIYELIRALKEHQFMIMYQPIVDLETKRPYGVEILTQLNHPHRGIIAPDKFIHQLEFHGLIAEHTYASLEHALAQWQQWQQQGLNLHLSINLSVCMLHDLTMPDKIMALLNKHQAPPEILHIEVTESCLSSHPAALLEILNRLNLRGIHLSIDDFGTGFSSLERLHELPMDTVKLDKKFITEALQSEAYRSSLEATIVMAKRLNLKLVAEGVEDVAAWNMVNHCGVNYVQGYYVAKALAGAELLPWSEQWNQSHV